MQPHQQSSGPSLPSKLSGGRIVLIVIGVLVVLIALGNAVGGGSKTRAHPE